MNNIVKHLLTEKSTLYDKTLPAVSFTKFDVLRSDERLLLPSQAEWNA